jgi:hypothetical protein
MAALRGKIFFGSEKKFRKQARAHLPEAIKHRIRSTITTVSMRGESIGEFPIYY